MLAFTRYWLSQVVIPLHLVPQLSPTSANSPSQQQLTTTLSQQFSNTWIHQLTNTLTHSRTHWVEFILRPTVSLPVRLGIGLPFGTHDQILSLSFLLWQLICCSSCRALSLTRGRFWNLRCNRWLVRSLRTNDHTLPSHLRLCSPFVACYDSQGLRWRYSNLPPHGSPIHWSWSWS
jgi:hypothetical protein